MEYRQIPVCAGHDDDGDPIIELVEWPFVLPKSLENWLHGRIFMGFRPCAINVFFPKWYCFNFKLFILTLTSYKVQMFLSNGFLRMLLDPDRLEDYWRHMLQEYVGHPASGKTAQSVPLSLYGVLVDFFGLIDPQNVFSFFTGLLLPPQSGDEGQAFGMSYMAFHFQADLSPCPTDAGVSRFLITTVPSNFYVSGKNLEYVYVLCLCPQNKKI